MSVADVAAWLPATTGAATRGRAHAGVARRAGGSGGRGSRGGTQTRARTRQGAGRDERARLAEPRVGAVSARAHGGGGWSGVSSGSGMRGRAEVAGAMRARMGRGERVGDREESGGARGAAAGM
nr:cell death regulator Aven-like [Aegilops tauschii subsp. strangulata]